MSDLLILEIYQHYKGDKYMLLSLAKQEATGEEVAVYQGVNDSQVWVRPVSEFAPPRFVLAERPVGAYHIPSAKKAREMAKATLHGRPGYTPIKNQP